jgi:hypothetical protein
MSDRRHKWEKCDKRATPRVASAGLFSRNHATCFLLNDLRAAFQRGQQRNFSAISCRLRAIAVLSGL